MKVENIQLVSIKASQERATEYETITIAMRNQTRLLQAILQQLPIAQPEGKTSSVSEETGFEADREELVSEQEPVSSNDPVSRSLQGHTSDLVCITGSYPFGTGCRQYCPCICHSPSTVKTPSFIKQALGSLFMKFSGVPVLTPRCDNKACAKEKGSGVKFDYFFPSWLCARRIITQFTTSDLQAPELKIRIPRVRPNQAPVFNLARCGDTEGLRTLFEKGLASPYDIDSEGHTALHVSLTH